MTTLLRTTRRPAADAWVEAAASLTLQREGPGSGGTTGRAPGSGGRALQPGSRRSRLGRQALTGLAALAGLCVVATAARAQSPGPNQPLAIEGLPPAACPLLVPRSDSALQPLRIQPSEVARKNAIGCLSPADAAVYGPDGCPLKLCTAPQGTVPLPQL